MCFLKFKIHLLFQTKFICKLYKLVDIKNGLTNKEFREYLLLL